VFFSWTSRTHGPSCVYRRSKTVTHVCGVVC
jgi:hypothetical protein